MTPAPWPQVGMLARWLGEPKMPGGVSANPPAPGQWMRPDDGIPREAVDCEIIAVTDDTPLMDRLEVTRLRVIADGREFDPRVDSYLCVPLVHWILACHKCKVREAALGCGTCEECYRAL